MLAPEVGVLSLVKKPCQHLTLQLPALCLVALQLMPSRRE